MRCAAVDDLEIYCDVDGRDKLVVSEDANGLYIETFMAVPGDGSPCICLNVETATELRDALSRWIGEQ
jgi:hypothetical protein